MEFRTVVGAGLFASLLINEDSGEPARTNKSKNHATCYGRVLDQILSITNT